MTRVRLDALTFALLALFAVACAGTPDGDKQESTTSAGDTAQPADITVADTAIVADAVVASDISGPADTGPSTACPGGVGCPCKDNSECDTVLCLETAAGKRCAATCIDTCPAGFVCAQVGVGGDVISACVAKFARLCDPCTTSKDCQHPGVETGRCINQGEGGSFCGAACTKDDDCPKSYGCKSAKTAEDGSAKQCVRLAEDGSDATYGVCPCSPRAAELALQTACTAKVKGADGAEASCGGTRTCSDKGLGDCTAPAPGPEVCDGKDNDCNGKVDDTACDDTNPCTVDKCDPDKVRAGEDGCSHEKSTDGLPCDADNTECTQNDSCQGGSCAAGKLKACDDGNPCTKDSCDAAKGCTQTVDDGVSCSDDNPCTIGDVCKDGGCESGKAKTCNPGDPCLTAKCDPTAAGKCVFKKKKKGAACNDGDACTSKDGCDDGTCEGAKVECDDKDPCTNDSCAPKTGCDYTANTAKCDDGKPCTIGDGCKDKQCLAGKAKVCDDSEPCTADSCDDKTGKCLYAGLPMEATPCNADDSVCTVGDVCKGGKCAAGAKKSCDDGKVCTADSCEAKTGCSHGANTEACDADSNACTVGDVCKDKQCQPGNKTICDDKNPCTADSCDKQSGKCLHDGKPFEGKGCDADGSVCTVADACKAGKCAAGAKKNCADGNVCTTDGCEAKAGCTAVANTLACDADSNACTVADSCKAKSCVAGKLTVCNDNNPCTADSCNAKTGKCAFAGKPLDGKGCDADGDACTLSDACNGGQCAAGKAKICDDKSACTADSCEKSSGKCLFASLAGQGCDDGDACTVGDVCALAAGKPKCSSGKAKVCDDANVCTTDGCDGKTGCTYKVQSGKKVACYGAPAKTKGVGTCKAGIETCDAKGKLGPCQGAVLPAKQEACDGKDDDCDGGTDEGCAAVWWDYIQTPADLHGSDGKIAVRAWVSGNVAGEAKGSKFGVTWSVWQWLHGGKK